MLRKIIHIDEDKCTGCGLCVDACHEGAIAMVDGKAITRAELRRETQLMAVTLRQRLNPEQYEAVAPRLQQEALRGIIIRRLLAGYPVSGLILMK